MRNRIQDVFHEETTTAFDQRVQLAANQILEVKARHQQSLTQDKSSRRSLIFQWLPSLGLASIIGFVFYKIGIKEQRDSFEGISKNKDDLALIVFANQDADFFEASVALGIETENDLEILENLDTIMDWKPDEEA